MITRAHDYAVANATKTLNDGTTAYAASIDAGESWVEIDRPAGETDCDTIRALMAGTLVM